MGEPKYASAYSVRGEDMRPRAMCTILFLYRRHDTTATCPLATLQTSWPVIIQSITARSRGMIIIMIIATKEDMLTSDKATTQAALPLDHTFFKFDE